LAFAKAADGGLPLTKNQAISVDWGKYNNQEGASKSPTGAADYARPYRPSITALVV